MRVICSSPVSRAAGAALVWRQSTAPVDLATGTYLSPRRALPDFSLIDQRGRALRAAQSARALVAAVLRLHQLPGFLPDDAHHARGAGEAAAGERRRGAAAGDLRVGGCEARHAAAAREVRAVLRSRFIGVTAADQPTIEPSRTQLGVGVDAHADARRQLHRRSFQRDLRARPGRQVAAFSPDRSRPTRCRRISSASWPPADERDDPTEGGRGRVFVWLQHVAAAAPAVAPGARRRPACARRWFKNLLIRGVPHSCSPST